MSQLSLLSFAHFKSHRTLILILNFGVSLIFLFGKRNQWLRAESGCDEFVLVFPIVNFHILQLNCWLMITISTLDHGDFLIPNLCGKLYRWKPKLWCCKLLIIFLLIVIILFGLHCAEL